MLKIQLPDEIVTKFESEGPLDKVVTKRLLHAADFTSEKPLYITDVQRRRLDRLFGCNISSPEALIHLMEKYVTARIGEVDVTLSPVLLSRLKTRCFGKPFETFLSDLIVRGLEEYVGMR
jgi:hypothetical protein